MMISTTTPQKDYAKVLYRYLQIACAVALVVTGYAVWWLYGKLSIIFNL